MPLSNFGILYGQAYSCGAECFTNTFLVLFYIKENWYTSRGDKSIKIFLFASEKGLQSNLVISNSLISNYHLSQSENLTPVLTCNYDNR